MKSVHVREQGIKRNKNPHFLTHCLAEKNVDFVDDYFFKSISPMFTTSPAPIVINKSPFMQFF